MKNGRLHIRLDEKTATAVKELAKRRGTTITALINQYLLQLIAEEEKESVEPAEQI